MSDSVGKMNKSCWYLYWYRLVTVLGKDAPSFDGNENHQSADGRIKKNPENQSEWWWRRVCFTEMQQRCSALCATPTCLSACLTTSRRISSHIRTREWLSSWTVWVAPETWCPRGVGVGSRSGERRCQSMVSVHTARHCCVQSRAWEWLLMTVRMLSRSVCPSMDTPPVMQNNVTGSTFSTASPHPFTTVTCAQAEPEAHLGTCGGPDNYNTGILITLVP